ncbi:ABC transporter substrate-binding protein [Paenibacillus sp.]|uniref:ABC transporter substrate-binding protein n=1 Tax=Paenibacillus sp. TaxID=58172 RepID=UPI002D2B8948|nr:extracellular solute-binding protein [Paenibacillus sp.]HZG84023.1 extracellular solute-binding protein [Paenibacillus sp.]
MKLKKSFLVMAAILLMVVSVLSGCGSSSNSGSGESASPQKNETEAPSTAETGAVAETGGAGEEKVEIEVWSWLPKSNEWPKLIEAFEKANPNIAIKPVTYENKTDYEQKLKLAMATGEGPDVIANQFGAFLNSMINQVEPLEPYVTKEWGDKWTEQFKPTAVERLKSIPGMPGMPIGLVAVPLIMYDADMFEQAGITELPKTYDELKETLKKIEQANLPGVMPHLGFGGNEWGPQVRALYVNLANQIAPNKIYEADAGKIPFTDPDLVKAAELMKQYADDNVFQPGFLANKLNPDVQNELFYNKKAVPMIMIGSWGVYTWTDREKYKIADRKFGYFPLPPSVGTEPNVQGDVNYNLSITKFSEKKEAAWEFVKFMGAGEYQAMQAISLAEMPAAASVEGYDKNSLQHESEKDALDTITRISEQNTIGFRSLENAEVESALFKQLQMMLDGKQTPEEAMKQVQSVSEKVNR